MAFLKGTKIALVVMVLLFNPTITNCQRLNYSDTIPIRYIAWNHYLDTCFPVLIQKKGFIVINRSNPPELLTTQKFWVFEDVLDNNKKREPLCILKFIPYYMN